jgi:prepilin-type N-terminal cleavage/methylation domain-containing protein
MPKRLQAVKLDRKNGYTLIELIVVIALISILLFFSIPRFRQNVLLESSKEATRWIMIKVGFLKKSAVRDNEAYILHVSFDSGRLWISKATSSDEERLDAERTGYELPKDIRLLDVEFPGKEKVTTGRADIYFHPKGYSDKAVIHIQDEDAQPLSFLIEPFLPKVKIYNEYVGFEQS